MMTPETPEFRMPPAAPPSAQSRMIDLVMLTEPKPPGSRQSISPPLAVFEIAPAQVLQGAVRLHGLASSPTPEIQVRVAWALAGVAKPRPSNIAVATNPSILINLVMRKLPLCSLSQIGQPI